MMCYTYYNVVVSVLGFVFSPLIYIYLIQTQRIRPYTASSRVEIIEHLYLISKYVIFLLLYLIINRTDVGFICKINKRT